MIAVVWYYYVWYTVDALTEVRARMRMVVFAFALVMLLALSVPPAAAAKPHFLRLLEARTKHRTALYHAAARAHKGGRGAGPQQFWYTQRLNHFGRSLGKTWKQRYWVNEVRKHKHKKNKQQ